jgi:hypothetical protein
MASRKDAEKRRKVEQRRKDAMKHRLDALREQQQAEAKGNRRGIKAAVELKMAAKVPVGVMRPGVRTAVAVTALSLVAACASQGTSAPSSAAEATQVRGREPWLADRDDRRFHPIRPG